MPEDSGKGNGEGDEKASTRPTVDRWLRLSPLLSLLAVILYAWAGDFVNEATFLSVLALGSIVAGAALIVGALAGFLFGLPRTLEETAAQKGGDSRLVTNTNLDQISDWLTKILIGLGLVELSRIAGGVDSLATSLTPGLGNGEGTHAFAIGLLIYCAVDGFLVGYLWTRIVVSRSLKQAADELLRNQVLGEPPPAAPPGPLQPPPGPQKPPSDPPKSPPGGGPSTTLGS